MNLKIALLQLLPGKDLAEQFQIGKAACEKAKAMDADIALFPEMWSDGYVIPQDENAIKELSITTGSDFIQGFKKLALELQMAIGITFLESHDPKPLNSIILFDRRGNEILHYSKVHTCAFDLEKMLSPGEEFLTADLDIGRDIVKIGSMICFDREFPESARILMLKGAEIILAPNACPMEINRLSALRTRAYENMLAIATCNYPDGQPDCNGHSTVFDGVAWLRDEPGVRDMCILEALGEEGIYVADIDLDLLREYRANEVMGNKYRHPKKYRILASDDKYVIREIRKQEVGLMKDFLYEAIFIPKGVEPPTRDIVEKPELRIYTDDFGTRKGDYCLVADYGGRVVGAVWTRIMNDYGHVDDDTPSFAISLYKEYRSQGIGSQLMLKMLELLKRQGYERASLAVQKANYAVKMYEKVGFKTIDENAEEYIMVCKLQEE